MGRSLWYSRRPLFSVLSRGMYVRRESVISRVGEISISAGPVPLCQCALLLKEQKAPGELDHAAADPGIAGSGEPLFPPLRTTLVRRARQAGVTRHRFSITHWPREHLMDQHISRFNADTDDPSQQPNHACDPVSGAC